MTFGPDEKRTTKETLFVVDFLNSNANSEEKRSLENKQKIEEIQRFFERCKLVHEWHFIEARPFRSSASNSNRRKTDEALYDASFTEAVFRITCVNSPTEDLLQIYKDWCRKAPIEGWVGRSADLPLFDNSPKWFPWNRFPLEGMAFGVMLTPSTFCPETYIKKYRESNEHGDTGQNDVTISVGLLIDRFFFIAFAGFAK